MLNPWRSELSLILVALLFAAFLGKLFHHPVVVLWGLLAAYLGHHLFHISRLLKWLRSGKSSELPKGAGIWEEIYYLIFRLRRRNRRRKKLLIRMLDRFRTATTALPDATVVLGAEDQIDWFNEAAGDLLGLRRFDIGQKIGNLIRSPRFTSYLEAADYGATVGIPSPGAQNIQLEIRIVPYGEGLRLLVAQDVTQLRFMERVRSDFVANVSHELRTPLTVIRGYVETLSDSAGQFPERYGQMFHRMEEQTLRMQSLIDGLLSLTRLESVVHPISQRPVDVPLLLEDICEEARHPTSGITAIPEVRLQLDADDGLVGVEQELRSAFSNLVMNAVKYCASGDRITVRWFEENGGMRLDVEDTGPGIEPEHLPRLTERFYRVDPGRGGPEGFGLGLAIVKHVMVRHGAEFRIRSTPGKGSCFSCLFPAGRSVQYGCDELAGAAGDDTAD